MTARRVAVGRGWPEAAPSAASVSWERKLTATSAPSRAKPTATARPMEREDPVTTATLSRNRIIRTGPGRPPSVPASLLPPPSTARRTARQT